MMGDVAVLHGPVPTQEEVRQITAWTGAVSVVHVAGIGGTLRQPRLTVLRGPCGEVVRRENGITYRFDPSRVMFAMGNRTERARMGTLVSPQDRVGDLCAGIGYFTLPMARAGASVHAIDLNPVAYRYLCRNIAENGVTGRVTADLGDCRDCMHGTYDRIVIGHFQGAKFLPHALAHAHAGTALHLHGLSDAAPDIRRCAAEHGYSAAVQERRVKKYGPHRWHVVWDVVLS
jgi:tRNA wybutosine-synthesizing protein 2